MITPKILSQNISDSLRLVISTSVRQTERFHASVLLAHELLPSMMDSAHLLLKSAQALEAGGNVRQQADYFNTWGLYHWYMNDRKQAVAWFKRTLLLPVDEIILTQVAAASNNIGALLIQLGEPDSARIYLLKSLEIDTDRNNETGMAKSLYDLANLHRNLDQQELAYRYITQAIKIQEKSGQEARLAFSYNSLGSIFMILGDKEKATEAYETGLDYAQKAGLERTVASVYNNMAAMWCETEGAFDKTSFYFEQGISVARELKNLSQQAILLTNMGTAWFTNDSALKAMDYYRQASEFYEQIYDPSGEAELFYRKGLAYRTLGEYDSALYNISRCLNLAEYIQSLSYQSHALLEMAILDSLQGDYRSSLVKYAQGIALRDSIRNLENRSRIAELQIIHETEQQALKIAELEHINRLARFRQRVLTGVSVLIILILALSLLYLQKRRKVSQQEYIIKKHEKEKIEAELEANRRELTGKALSLAKSDQLINQLKTDLQKLLPRVNDDTSHELRAALRLLKSKDNSKQLWGEFEKRFNELSEGFISRLLSRCPSLSPAEIRLCAMLRLQMSTKEISELIRRSTRTIEHTRSSTRKKLGLKASDNLVQHLLNL